MKKDKLHVYNCNRYWGQPLIDYKRAKKAARYWWKRQNNKKCIMIKMNKDNYYNTNIPTITNWINLNCKNDVYCNQTYYIFVFKNKQDALLFKLRWG